MKSFPMQPIVLASDGVVRFQENRIVSRLVKAAEKGQRLNINDIAICAAQGMYTDAEQMQLAQLIGYNVSGFGDLSYADRRVVKRADDKAQKIWEKRKPR